MNDSTVIANWFITKIIANGVTAKKTEILKLVYLAHGWHLESGLGPLVDDRFEAWEFGPVLPNLFAGLGRVVRPRDNTINRWLENSNPIKPIPLKTESLLQATYDVCKDVDPFALTKYVKEVVGAWHITFYNFGAYSKIPDDLILLDFKNKRSKANEQTARE